MKRLLCIVIVVIQNAHYLKNKQLNLNDIYNTHKKHLNNINKRHIKNTLKNIIMGPIKDTYKIPIKYI